MRQLFNPAVGLLSRLRFAHKFVLIGLVLVVAVAVVGRAYVQTQNAQIAFSAKERVGIRVIEPSASCSAASRWRAPPPSAATMPRSRTGWPPSTRRSPRSTPPSRPTAPS